MFTKSARFYDAIYAFKEYESEAEQLHAMIQARVPAAATLLDVACGTGLHLQYLTPHYTAEGRSYVTLAIGCTGGKHRSVALIEKLAKHLRDQDVMFSTRHRDLGKE